MAAARTHPHPQQIITQPQVPGTLASATPILAYAHYQPFFVLVNPQTQRIHPTSFVMSSPQYATPIYPSYQQHPQQQTPIEQHPTSLQQQHMYPEEIVTEEQLNV